MSDYRFFATHREFNQNQRHTHRRTPQSVYMHIYIYHFGSTNYVRVRVRVSALIGLFGSHLDCGGGRLVAYSSLTCCANVSRRVNLLRTLTLV